MIFNRHVLVRIAGFVACCFLIVVMSALNTGCALKGQGEIELLLVKGSKPVATIVIGKEASRSAQLAAAELQYHIEKITGARLPIVIDTETVNGPRILVGASKATQALGLRNSDFKNQEYLVRFLPDTLILMGKDKEDPGRMDYAHPGTFPGQFDEQATGYAVYDFLERYCDVRWYLPTEVGLVYPRRENLVVKGAEVRRTPAMKYRVLFVDTFVPADLCDDFAPSTNRRPRLDDTESGRREGELFASRQRLRGVELYNVNHSFLGYYRHFLKEHPEWFAKGYDKDMPEEMRHAALDCYATNKAYATYFPQMCYTSTGFIQQVITSARTYFDKSQAIGVDQAKGDYFPTQPMDNDNYCRCPECQALLHKKPPCEQWRKQNFFWNDRASDYVFGFVNKVAREVIKTHPDKYLSMDAYHEYFYPPSREPLEPNVAMTLGVYPRLGVCPAMGRARDEFLNRWADDSKTRQKRLWMYFHRPTQTSKFTHCFPGFMAHDMVKQMQRYHNMGIRGMFVEPAYMRVKNLMRGPIMDQLEFYVIFKLADDPTLDGNKLIDEFFVRYYGAAAKPMQMLYEKIEQAYCDPANYARLSDYVGYQTEEIAWGIIGTEERMAAFGKLMEAANTAAQTGMEKTRVALFEKAIWEHMKAGRKEYLESKSRKEKVMESLPPPQSGRAVRITGVAPGGDPGKVDWSKAEVMGKWFSALKGEPTSRRLEGRLLHDGQFLYVQLQEMIDTSKLVYRNDGIWDEDEWELFVARERGKEGYRQMGVNAKGTHQDLAYGEEQSAWDSGVKVASDTSAPDRWVVRVAFPLKTLLPGGVQPGQTIYLNVGRDTAGASDKTVSWVPTFTDSFRQSSRLGAIRLDD